MNKRLLLTLTSLLTMLLMLAIPSVRSVQAVSGAAFTTTNTAEDGTGHCQNGNEAVNCNIYDGKQYVWLSGGPVSAALEDGDYFFAVLEPGGQNDPNDGGANNLSDDYDTYAKRTFSISGSSISYDTSLGHDFANNKIRLYNYADTGNPGGVYILAICSLASGYPVDPSSCKYDAFKVANGTPAQDLVVSKTAVASYELAYTWTIAKSADPVLVRQVGGSATFNYVVKVSHDAGAAGNWKVTGQITVENPNAFDVAGVDVTDAVDNNGTCTVSGGTDVTVPGSGSVVLDYTCTYAASPNPPSGVNTATATWYEGSLKHKSGTADFDFDAVTPDPVDECVDVTDSYAGDLGTVCVGDANPTELKYSRTIPVPQFDCLSYNNTATFTTNDTGTTGSASQTVTVCGPIKTGALTMGFWQNKNGQGIITGGASTLGVCNSATFLRGYAPFQDLSATATCAQVGTYVTNVIKAASASGAAMNPMLKGQMLATALDVFFSDPAKGGNKINAPTPIGGVLIDLTYIKKGTGYENTSAAFGGATQMTVAQVLAYAASQSNSGGSVWYGQVKSTQELAKDTFDAINNQWVFAPIP